ncbi:MAB_1171c family putative transporter [Microbacterium sp. NPDC056044]|uniref:MAB_1171c family putative transporter n=1 Tax=Microbacterium sp. NPDC056044 TaxID=3345690 RepID=UPI0035E2B4DF
MIQAVIAVLMWALVVSLLILRRRRTERSITYAAITIAIAMTLSVDAVYAPVDALFGGSNIGTLIADAALMIGVFFLGRGIMRATEYRPLPVRIALGSVTLVVALVGLVVAFALINTGSTTTNFMLDLGGQPAAAAYSIIQFTYYGIVVAAMAAVAIRQFRLRTGIQRIPAGSLIIGAVLGVSLSIVVIVMDIAHLAGNLDLMVAVGILYAPLFLLTFVFLCVGLAGQPALRYMGERRRLMQTQIFVRQLTPLWDAATRVRPGLRQRDATAIRLEDPEIVLHREVVEIRDAMIDPRVEFDPTSEDRQLLERAEAHLLGSSAR